MVLKLSNLNELSQWRVLFPIKIFCLIDSTADCDYEVHITNEYVFFFFRKFVFSYPPPMTFSYLFDYDRFFILLQLMNI